VLYDLVGFTGSGLAHELEAFATTSRTRAPAHPRTEDGAGDHRLSGLLTASRQPVVNSSAIAITRTTHARDHPSSTGVQDAAPASTAAASEIIRRYGAILHA